jgi:hypothetical protein
MMRILHSIMPDRHWHFFLTEYYKRLPGAFHGHVEGWRGLVERRQIHQAAAPRMAALTLRNGLVQGCRQ